MKIDLVTPTRNSRTGQLGCTLKQKQLRKIGITPEQFWDRVRKIDWPKPRVKQIISLPKLK